MHHCVTETLCKPVCQLFYVQVAVGFYILYSHLPAMRLLLLPLPRPLISAWRFSHPALRPLWVLIYQVPISLHFQTQLLYETSTLWNSPATHLGWYTTKWVRHSIWCIRWSINLGAEVEPLYPGQGFSRVLVAKYNTFNTKTKTLKIIFSQILLHKREKEIQTRVAIF